MQVDVQIGGRTKTLDQGDGAGSRCAPLDAGLFDEMRGNGDASP